MRPLCLTAIWLFAHGASIACLHDRDTLESEARLFPDTAQVITGRFERNPPLYYEMRLHRVADEIESHPDRLGLYDDAGVAADRLGRSGEGLRWMERKRERLERIDPDLTAQKEHWYRYYANVGTFRVHRWLKEGADRGRIAEVKRARNEIARAIRLKPNAHSGREKYQLDAMDWILYPGKLNGKPEPLAASLYRKRIQPLQSDSAAYRKAADEAVKGLSGLIVLGNAWMNVDVFHALSVLLDIREYGALGHLARLRREELTDMGRKPLFREADLGAAIAGAGEVGLDNREWIERDYTRLRREADEWQDRRGAAVLSLLRSGRHPDMDPAFWAGVGEKDPPRLTYSKRPGWWVGYALLSLILIVPLAVLAVRFVRFCIRITRAVLLHLKEEVGRRRVRREVEQRLPEEDGYPIPDLFIEYEEREREEVLR